MINVTKQVCFRPPEMSLYHDIIMNEFFTENKICDAQFQLILIEIAASVKIIV